MSGVEQYPQQQSNFEATPDYPPPPAGFVQAQQQIPPLSSSKQLTGLGIQPAASSHSQSINTRVWQALNGFARQQEDGSTEIPSTAAPSVVDEQRYALDQADQQRAQHYRSMGPPVHIPQSQMPIPNVEEYSATEANTPSLAGTPDFKALASSSNQTRVSPGHLQPGQLTTGSRREGAVSPVQPSSLRREAAVPVPVMQTTGTQTSRLEIQNLMQSYGRRLDLLESLSFSHVPVEELQERFELFDGRILDLEQFRADHEREHEHAASPEPVPPPASKKRHKIPIEMGSFSSDVSFDSNAAAHTEAVVMATLATNSITHPRLEALETRVTDIENAAGPSFARPWRVEVVLLPWGDHLRGIWFSANEATQRSMKSSTQLSDEWSGAQSATKLSFKSQDTAAWTTESIQAWANDTQEWLSPKACGPSGTVFQRLESRGLVRMVELKASDSRHLLNTLKAAFGALLPNTDEVMNDASQYQALSEDFVPLRKVRKSSRLRFLDRAEMITSATWTAEFLDSSVFMKVSDGQRRLYITTPDAYLQTAEQAWTWPQLRQLPMHGASIDEQTAEATGNVIEACWSYNEHLDHAPSAQSSFVSHGSFLSTRTPDAPDSNEAEEIQLASSKPEAQRHHRRTISLPSSASAALAPMLALPKRRVASFETAGMVPITSDDHGLEVQAKRRRISISPEAERRGVNFTPRWSREPPSPFTSEVPSQGASSRHMQRGTTPFAYATPHSNTQYPAKDGYFEGDGDTEVDTDLAGEASDHGEEEWEGVDDGSESSMDEDGQMDDDDDEDDVDEGLMSLG